MTPTGAVPKDDDIPAHRVTADEYFLRIGDCQFVIPPTNIRVIKSSSINTTPGLRQMEPIKTKDGYTTTQINIELFFNGREQINGFEMTAPDGGKYYMDGLRSLVAQFRRLPFLPIINEHLNNIHDIHNVALASMVTQNVPGFPYVFKVGLTLYKMTVTPYINLPDWSYDEIIMYPLFRWYYQQMLKPASSLSKMTLAPVMNFDMGLHAYVLKEDLLRDANNKTSGTETPVTWQEMPIPEDLIITNFTVSMGNVLTPMQLSFSGDPTYQYFGSLDTRVSLTMHTQNKGAIIALDELRATLERYSREYRNRIVTGYAMVYNEILSLFGITYAMIENMAVNTVEGYPGTFEIVLDLISYDKTRRASDVIDPQASGAKLMKIPYLEGKDNKGGTYEDLITKESNAKMNAINDIKLKKFINQIELYPDLELPPLEELAKAVDQINTYRQSKGQEVLPVTSANFKGFEMSVYANPDFYISYPPITSLPANASDLDAVINASKAVQHKQGTTTQSAANAAAAVSTGTQPKPSAIPKAMTVTGNDNGSKIWNFLIDKGVGPRAVAGMMGNFQQESQLSPTAENPSSHAYGIAQWLGSRKTALQIHASSLGLPISSLEAQLSYLWKELTGSESATLSKINSATSIRDAVIIFENGFERGSPAEKVIEKRTEFANSIYAKYANGSVPTTGQEHSVGATMASATKAADEVLAKRLLEGNKLPMKSAITKVVLPKDKAGQDEWLKGDHDPVIDCRNPSDESDLGELIEEMGLDMRLYNQRSTMNRAFPTFLMLMVDEGMWVDGRRLWDNYYAYHMLTSIEITHERSQPVGTAVITMSDVYGALNYTPWHTYNIPDVSVTGVLGYADKAMTSIADGLDGIFHTHMLDDYKRMKFGMLPTINDDIIKDRNSKYAMLRVNPGTRIHLRMGYGSVASLLPVNFNGSIVEIDTGDIITAICQSDGLELANMLGDFAGQANATNSYYDLWGLQLGSHPQGIFFKILKDRDHNLLWSLTNSQTSDDGILMIAAACKRHGMNNAYGIEHFGYLDHADRIDSRDNENAFGVLFNMDGYDLIKNIYSSYYGYEELDWSYTSGNGSAKIGKDNAEPDILLKMTDKSLWDIGQVLADTVPEYICAPHYHGFHSTLFYGMPHYYVKYDYDLLDPNGDYSRENLAELYKPFQQIHIFNSAEDILCNNIKVSSRDLATVVAPSYMFDDDMTCDDKIWADPTIKPELLRVQAIDTQIVQDFFMNDWISKYIFSGGATVVNGLKDAWNYLMEAQGKISAEDVKKASAKLRFKAMKDWNPGRFQARNAGTSYMVRNFRNMYRGELTILGDPSIKPHDSMMLTDFYSKMHGMTDVGRVTHHMGVQTGFMTSIKPDLISTVKGSTRGFLHSTAIKLVGSVVSYTIARKLAMSFISRSSDKIPMSALKGFSGLVGRGMGAVTRASSEAGSALGMASRIRVFVRGLFVASTTAEVAAAPVSMGGTLVAAAIEIAAWTLIDQAFNYIEREFFPESAINIYPLWYKEWPYVAGIDCAKQIIPGFSLDNSSPSSDGEIGSSSSGGLSNTIGGNLSYYPLSKSDCNGSKNEFGPNKNYSSGIHHGLDFGTGVQEDRPIYAHYDGIVESVGLDPSYVYGKHVILKHAKHPRSNRTNYYTLYAHLNSASVAIGNSVKAGQNIGASGQTGNCRGAHLHFECRASSNNDGDCSDAFNPRELLQESTYPA